MRFDVRCIHLDNSEHVDRHARDKMLSTLKAFAHRIERIDVLLDDLHGTRHGIERRCIVRVAIHGAGEAVVQHIDPDVYHAIDEAAHRIKRTVRRRITRRRDIAHDRWVDTRHAA